MGPHSMYAGRRAGKRASLLVPLFLFAMAGYGQTTFWSTSGAGNFLTAGNWSNGVPDMATNATIANGTIGTPTVVNLNGSAGSVLDLTLGANDSLNVNLNSSLSIYGASASNGGTITVTAGSGNNTFLELDSNVALTGSGTLTLSYGDHNGNAFVEESGGSFTLTNSSTIEGDGIIGNGGLTFANATGGIVNANVSAQSLTLNGTGGITNAGLLEATGGGVLQISSNVANAGGNITANDGTVDVSATVTGGTLTTLGTGLLQTVGTATLDTVTIASLSTYTGGLGTTTALLGTITNMGNLQLDSGSGHNTFLGISSNTTLQGGGTVTLNSGDINGLVYIQQNSSNLTLTNMDNQVQGYGDIGNSGLTFANATGGIVDANVMAQTLTLDGTGGITNAGLLEATGGGVLQISSNVANAGGNITANSGTVDVSATVTGGTLTTLGTGVMQTGVAATLDTVTIASLSTYTGGLGTTTSLLGTITNLGNLQLDAGSGHNTSLGISSNTTLQGGGTVTLNSGDTNGLVYVVENSSNLTLTNMDNQVQGYGDIGHGGLTFVNSVGGTVDANVTGRTLTLDGAGGITNPGLLEATAGGTLQVSTPVNNFGGNVTANGGIVSVSSVIQGGTLNSLGGGTLQTTGSATLDGTSQGPLTISGGSTYTGIPNSQTTLMGMIIDQGNIQMNAGSGTNTYINVVADTTLQGGGTVTLSSGDNNGHAYIQETGGSFTLTNEITIQGYGVIGNGGLTLANASGGAIDANVPGQTLTVNPTGGFTNTGGTTEASNGGILALSTSVIDNAGGTIVVNGASSSVQFVNNVSIQGGTLTSLNGGTLGVPGTSITLDGSTEGALTLSSGSTYTGGLNTNTSLLGTIVNNGTIQLAAGSGNNTSLYVAANTTLQGGGVVTLNSGDDNGQVWVQQASGGLTLTNVDNTFQGYGIIGHGGLAFANDAAGTIDANASGQTLFVNGTGNVVNAGLLEATGNGTLNITNLVANAGANITANGGTVLINGGATIEGGTLNSLNGGALGVGASSSATLDGSTLGTITLSPGSTYAGGLNSVTNVVGTLDNQGNIQLNAGSGNNTSLNLNGATTLMGGGTVTLNSGDNNGQVYVLSGAGSALTNVDNTVQGYGDIGHGTLSLSNGSSGIIDANSPGNTLLLDGSGNVTNAGSLEATNGGLLKIANVVTNSGNVTSSAGTVDLVGGTIQGGTLNGPGLETTGAATLDGSTNGPLTLSAGSVYTGGLNTTTTAFGTLDNQGNLQINAGSGTNTVLTLSANATLLGGGTVTLNSGDDNGQAFIQETVAGMTLTNSQDVIEGYGVIGNGGLSLLNGVAGTVLANIPGQTLVVNAAGAVTNDGTFQADDSTLSLVSLVSNFSGNTLTAGTWTASNGGTVSFEGTVNSIVTNDATLILSGAGSGIQTKTGAGNTYQQLEQTLASNGGTLEVLGGRDFPAANSLANNGLIQLGGGTLTAPSLSNGPAATLAGFGTFSPTGGVAIANGAQLSPGGAVAGQRIATLSFGGSLTFGSGGIYVFDLKNAPSAVAGTDYDTINVAGPLSVTAAPLTPFSITLRSIDPATGNPGLANFNAAQPYSWTLVTAGSVSGFSPADFSFDTSGFQNPLGGGTFLVGQSGNMLTLNFTPVPEPGTWALMLGGLGALAVAGVRRRPRFHSPTT
jgi:fibronectin-binding autotransporter adhesin